MSGTPVAVIIAHQPFPAPDVTIRAVAGAVQRDADDRAVVRPPSVIGQAGGQVSVVVLNSKWRMANGGWRIADGELGSQVVGVQVVGDDLRFDAEQMFIKLHCSLEVF